jgi:hypothetical protein
MKTFSRFFLGKAFKGLNLFSSNWLIETVLAVSIYAFSSGMRL